MRKRQKQGGGQTKEKKGNCVCKFKARRDQIGKERVGMTKVRLKCQEGAEDTPDAPAGSVSVRWGRNGRASTTRRRPQPEDDTTFHPTSLHIQHFAS